MNEAEKRLGRPVTYIEVFAACSVLYGYCGFKQFGQGYTCAFVQNMYREDLFYADKNFVFWSTNNQGEGKAGFETFSQRFKRLFPGYYLDSSMHIRAEPATKTLNLKELMRLFLSKDEQLWQQSKWIFENERKYLDGAPNKANKVGFQSFPRSGNTFLRKYFELLTGVETGADNTLNVNIHLQLQGLKGEDIVDDTVWIVKTHSPWIMP